MKNSEASRLFEEMADIMEILGEDVFRINSYLKVSRVISGLPGDIDEMFASGKLAETPGIGKSSLSKIEEFIKTGKIIHHQELLNKIPVTLLELLKVQAMGPKGIKAVYEKLNVKTIDDLKKVIQEGKLAQLHGFGEKKTAAIAKGIDSLTHSSGRIHLHEAFTAANIAMDFLNGLDGIEKIAFAGSLRRYAETVGDVDILVAAKDGKRIIDSFVKAYFVRQILSSGDTKGSAIINTEICPVQVDVRVVPKDSFGAALNYFTGSKPHNVHLRDLALKAKLKLNEYGLFRGEKMIAGKTENEIYEKLGLDYVEPVLREDRGEIDAAIKHKLPKIIRLEDIKGDCHMHTTASDGRCEINEVLEAARGRGYKYICITDHSGSAGIANGLSPDRLFKHIENIRKAAQKFKDIEVFVGSEVDILADGSMDYSNEIMARLDFVIGSIHSGMTSPREKVTMRTLKAMDNPYVHCIAHPTGRLINEREPMDIDMEAVIKHASQTNTALEINSSPYRLDLKDVHVKMAIDAGVKLMIGTDSHKLYEFAHMSYGVATAGRGWATKDDVINALPLDKFKKWLFAKRKR